METTTICGEILKKKYIQPKCIHNKRKSICRECKGSSICIHDKHKQVCRDCKGSAFCIHDKQKSRCRDCKGSKICIHDKYKPNCRECKGSSFCIHNKHKSICRECKGSSICIHDKHKQVCRECGGSHLCKTEKCETIATKKYDKYCIRCFMFNNPDVSITHNYKTKEKHVVDHIGIVLPDYTFINDKRVVDGCSKRRPDLLLDLGSHLIIIEIDENKHTSYTTECELARLNDLSNDVGFRPIVMIRFNPDGYTTNDGIKIKSCWKVDNRCSIMVINSKMEIEWNARLQYLVETIKYYIVDNPVELITIKELYY